MMSTVRRCLAAGLAMLAAAGLALAMKPSERMADRADALVLERVVPEQFGDWRIDPSIVPVELSPEVRARLDEIYNQTLSRTYVNGAGERIMLSIAYGADQSGDATQVHRPEFCYTAQGFEIVQNSVNRMVTRFGALSVRRLVAVAGLRNEPITYWVTVGETATLPGIERKLAQLRYGLTGVVPDGMLVRVSSIARDADAAYALQDRFVEQMLEAVDERYRLRIAGTFAAS
jgi:EpsI family protein